jgi:hypothetical protein
MEHDNMKGEQFFIQFSFLFSIFDGNILLAVAFYFLDQRNVFRNIGFQSILVLFQTNFMDLISQFHYFEFYYF